MSPLIATLLSTWAYFTGAPWPAIIVIFLFVLSGLLAITYYGAKNIDHWKNRRAKRHKKIEAVAETMSLNPIVPKQKEELNDQY